jgi:hypothetical protein
VLVWSSRWLTLFEKHHTRSDEARSLAQKLFFSQVRLYTPGLALTFGVPVGNKQARHAMKRRDALSGENSRFARMQAAAL